MRRVHWWSQIQVAGKRGRSVVRAGIPLTAGPHVLRVVCDTNGPFGWFGNLNYFRWFVPGPNSPPSVQVTSPADGANFTAPATIGLGATASNLDGSVTQVAFYAGSSLVGTDTTSPFTASWTNVPVGNYSLTAVATDNAGASTTSGAVTVGVVVPPSSTPFGTAAAIPGVVEAENFDGGRGDCLPRSDDGQYSRQVSPTDVDVETTSDVSGGHSLGYMGAGE